MARSPDAAIRWHHVERLRARALPVGSGDTSGWKKAERLADLPLLRPRRDQIEQTAAPAWELDSDRPGPAAHGGRPPRLLLRAHASLLRTGRRDLFFEEET